MEGLWNAVLDFVKLPRVGYALDAVVKMLLTVLFSGIIGYEREHSHRPAGFRTHILVAVGSTLVMMTSNYDFHQYERLASYDPTRL